MPEMNDDFYVGYQPRASRRVRGHMLRTIVSLCGFGFVIAILLVFSQAPFPDSSFDYGVRTRYQGRLMERPYPMLLANGVSHLLVGEGKHGVGSFFAGKDGRYVELEGSAIVSGEMHALEVAPGSYRELKGSAAAAPVPKPLGRVSLVGEIVDTKCRLGVMNPGSGKVHRSCAARCLSGGIPPGLLVRDAAGKTATILLEGVEGRDVLDLVAEPVSASGRLRREGTVLILNLADRFALKRE